ncbi:MAG: hypothetical protein H0W36_08325 [Gemmatimonadetes bacterium]|nr:hypothetical protein [Gemmatimonadota bacterium]
MASGNRSAFHDVFQRHTGEAAYLRAMAEGAGVPDLVQEAFVRLWE